MQSDVVAQGYGSLGMMTSVLYAENDVMESEAAHGTITRHYRNHQKGLETSSNSVASIFAWTKALDHRGRLDKNDELVNFAKLVESCVIETVESGKVTKDLASAKKMGGEVQRSEYLNTEEFIGEIAKAIQKRWLMTK